MSLPTNLHGQPILIIESEIAFVQHLQSALQQEGAETVTVRDPYSEEGTKHIAHFAVRAAVINSVHRSVARGLGVPVLIYGPNTEVPAQTDAVVRELKRILA